MLKIPRVDLQRPLADFCVCYEKRQHPENEGLEDLNQVKLLRINQVGRVFVLKQNKEQHFFLKHNLWDTHVFFLFFVSQLNQEPQRNPDLGLSEDNVLSWWFCQGIHPNSCPKHSGLGVIGNFAQNLM